MAETAQQIVEPVAPAEPISQQSVEDRIAAKMYGLKKKAIAPEPPPQPEPAAEPEAQAPAADTPKAEKQAKDEAPADEGDGFVEVEYGDAKYSVPKELKDALMREKDYSVKTTELASTRRAIEAQQKEIALARERQKFETDAAPNLDRLKMIDNYVKHIETTSNWAQMTTDQIVRARLEIDQLRQAGNDIRNELQRSYTAFEAKQKEAREKIRKESQESLAKSIPNWSEDVRQSVEKYLVQNGYPEFVGQHLSESDYRVAWKAMNYDKMQGEAAKLRAAAQEAKQTKPVRVTARRTLDPDKAKAMNFTKRLNETANDYQARQRVVEDRIGDKFLKF